MANPPTSPLIEQMQHDLADLTAQNQSILANIQHSNAVGAAQEAANMAQTDAFISALEGGGAPGFAPGAAPGFDAQAPHMDGFAPVVGPMAMQDAGAPIMDGQPFLASLDGQTPGLMVQAAPHGHDGGDAADIIESILGFDIDGDGEVAHGQGHGLDDAIQLAHDTGQVVVVEEVIVIDPGGDAQHDYSGGDFSL